MRITNGVTILVLMVAAAPVRAAPREERDIKVQHMRPENAACLIKRRNPWVRVWLGTLAGTKAERTAIRPVEQDFTACFTYFPNAYRSKWDYPGIRRGLVRELLRTGLTKDFVDPPPGLDQTMWFTPDQAADTNARPALLANNLGFCLARSDWRATHGLALTEEGSAEEKAALRGIIPKIAGCLPPGQRLTFDAARLRTILMETVYHAVMG